MFKIIMGSAFASVVKSRRIYGKQCRSMITNNKQYNIIGDNKMRLKQTQSIKITEPIFYSENNTQNSPKSNKNAKVDLLDFIQDEDSDKEGFEDGIQTFEEFLEVVNAYDFQRNQANAQRQPSILRPKISFPPAYKNSLHLKNTKSLQANRDKEQNSTPEQPKNYLDVVREEIASRSSFKNSKKLENLNNGLTISFKVNEQAEAINKQSIAGRRSSFENSVKKSSAHSSRSFNGFQQINQYEIRDLIGSGAFSFVYSCRDIHTQQQFAMKILAQKHFRKKLFRRNSTALANSYINNEIAILKKMEHPYIIKLFQVIEDEISNKIYLVLEYCAHGYINEKKIKNQNQSLGTSNMLLPYRKLLESQCKRYFKQIALAMDYMHNVVKIAHRDIKPENILLSDKDQVKISDFGLGTEDIEVASKSGTQTYLAPQVKNPEAFALQKINRQMSDIWALGITLIVLLMGKETGVEDDHLQSYVNNMKDISMECKDLLQKCLMLNPLQRITASEMIDHPWIMAKRSIQYTEIEISKEEQEKAIVVRNKDILREITKMYLPKDNRSEQAYKP